MAYRFNLLALAALAAPSMALPFDDGLWRPWLLPFDDGLYHPDGGSVTAPSPVSSDAAPAATSVAAALPTAAASFVNNAVAPAPDSTTTSPAVATVVVSNTESVTSTTTPAPAPPAATSAPAAAAPAPAPSSAAPAAPASTAAGPARDPPTPDAKKTYSGDGSAAAGWPEDSAWLSFDTLWQKNLDSISTGCVTPIVQNSDADIAAIKDGINAESAATGVDPRFILAVIMQESHGCVRVGQTLSPGAAVVNPGIMQDHNGPSNCADGGACPPEKIRGQIHDGTAGTDSGRGLQQEMDAAKSFGGATTAQQTYIAARLYNSGDYSYQTGGDLSAGGATSSYPSDIANRLIGAVF